MATSIAAVQAAYEKSQGQSSIAQREITDSTPRYIWYAAEDIPHPEATAGFTALMRERARAVGLTDAKIPAGYIERCRVAPVLSMPVWENAFDVPSELRVRGRFPAPNGEPTEYMYYVPAGHIFDSVMGDYGTWGVVELQAIVGGDLGDILELKIDETFFPQAKDRATVGYDGLPIDEIPREYSKMIRQINEKTADLKGDSRRNTLELIARDMLRSIEISKAFDVAYIEFEESQKELRYSLPGLRALHRLERQRRDYALNAMAEQQQATMASLPELIKGVAQRPGVDQEAITAAVTAAVAAVMDKFGASIVKPEVEPKPDVKKAK